MKRSCWRSGWLDPAHAHRLPERIIPKPLLELVRWAEEEPGHLSVEDSPGRRGLVWALALKRWFILRSAWRLQSTGKKYQQLLRIFFVNRVCFSQGGKASFSPASVNASAHLGALCKTDPMTRFFSRAKLFFNKSIWIYMCYLLFADFHMNVN